MRVVVTHDVADDAGTLHVAAVGTVAAVVHREQDLAVYRLEPVAHVRQRPADDDAHRVVEVRPLHLDLEADRLDPAADVAALDRRRVDRLAEVVVVVVESSGSGDSPSASPITSSTSSSG